MTQPIDPEFADRLAAYQQKAKKGIAFQAVGTVGGKKPRPQGAAWRARPLRALFRMVLFAVLVKAFAFHIATMAGFDARAIDVSGGLSPMQRAMGLVLYPDLISVSVSQLLTMGQLFFANELREIL